MLRQGCTGNVRASELTDWRRKFKRLSLGNYSKYKNHKKWKCIRIQSKKILKGGLANWKSKKKKVIYTFSLEVLLRIWKSNASFHHFCHFPSEDVIYLPHFKYTLKCTCLSPSILLLPSTPSLTHLHTHTPPRILTSPYPIPAPTPNHLLTMNYWFWVIKTAPFSFINLSSLCWVCRSKTFNSVELEDIELIPPDFCFS